MAHAKNHDYHILQPSILPFLGAVGGFVLLFGGVLWMKGMTPLIAIAGAVIVVYVMYAWWSEVVREAQAGDHTPVVRIGLRYGFILFILSEVMFFAAWFWTFFKHALYPMGPQSPAVDGVWPPAGIETLDPWQLPLINTLILLSSGAAATWAHHAIAHENNRKDMINGLAIAIFLGVAAFLLNVVVSAGQDLRAAAEAARVADWLGSLVASQGLPLTVLGPAPCPLTRIKARWRWHLLVKGPGEEIGRLVRYAAPRLEGRGSARVVLDRDPVSLL